MPISAQGIGEWMNLFNTSAMNNANRPHYVDMAQAARDKAVYDAQIGGAEAQHAPRYFGSRADQMTNQAGLTGLQMEYLPKEFQLKASESGMGNKLKQLQMDQIRAQMGAGGGFNPDSSFGKLQFDRMKVAKIYGEDSPEVKLYDRAIENELATKKGGGMTILDPATGNPIFISGEGGGGTVPTTATINKEQAKMSDALEALKGLDVIANNYSKNSLRYLGEGIGKVSSIQDKLGIPLTESQDQFLQKDTAFKNSVMQFFNDYKHAITGAAAGEKEMQMLKESILNEDQSPAQFQASYNLVKDKIRQNVAEKQRTLSSGYPNMQGNQEAGNTPLIDKPFGQQGNRPTERPRYNMQTKWGQ